MSILPHSSRRFRPSLAFVLLCVFLFILWIAGGASRADALGQVGVRATAAILLVVMILAGERPAFAPVRPIWMLLTGAIVLALVQLVPWPPGVWTHFPGRAMFVEATAASGEPQPWRPWSITPAATVNAAASLIVPIATLVSLGGLKPQERQWLPGLILGLVAASTLIALLQLSGAGFNNPFVNETPGQVSGTFANRNHLALFLTLGCLLAPVWAFAEGRAARWRGPTAIGLVLLFVLTILASGSRAGLLLGALALGIGLVLVRRGISRELNRYPRWVFFALIAGLVCVIAIFVLISVAADRAVAINRVFEVDPGQDMRSRGLPTVLAMIWAYFPMGSGLGGFDPIFRIHEPFELLKLTYFNHAHDDLLEVVLDAGLPGLLLLLGALLWWAWASIRAWRAGADARFALPKLGSAMLLLVIIASAFDYPARTPMIMAVMVVAGMWLSGGLEDRARSALPTGGQHL